MEQIAKHLLQWVSIVASYHHQGSTIDKDLNLTANVKPACSNQTPRTLNNGTTFWPLIDVPVLGLEFYFWIWVLP